MFNSKVQKETILLRMIEEETTLITEERPETFLCVLVVCLINDLAKSVENQP